MTHERGAPRACPALRELSIRLWLHPGALGWGAASEPALRQDGPLWPETGWPAASSALRALQVMGPHCTQGGGGSSASSSRAAPGFAMPTLRWDTKAPKDGWQDRGETPTSQGLGDCSQGSPRAKSFPHIPAEEKSPAAARVTNAGGIAPVQSLRRVSISSVGAAGPPGTSLTLKPSLAHMSHVSR